MRTSLFVGSLLSFWLLAAGCYPNAVGIEPDASREDGQQNTSDGGETSDADGGASTPDVANGNDAQGSDAPKAADSAPAADACGVPASCGVTFSYPKGSESKVELFGDFSAWKTGLPLALSGSTWKTTVTLNHAQKVLYKFVLDGTTWVPDPNNPNQTTDSNKNSILNVSCPATCGDGGGGSLDTGVTPDSSAGTDAGSTGSFDWRDAVMYFVLLDRFSDGDASNNKAEQGVKTPANFQGGDLKGLLNKINAGYFNTLGVNTLWISSPVDAPDGKYKGTDGEDYTGYHGYWPTNLNKVEERLGDLALLKQVVAAAHQKGIRVVMDYVMNHVHSSSPTYKSNASWFWSLNYNNKTCVCGQGCSWDADPDRLRCWFMDYLPDFNFSNSAARQYSVQNAIKWIKDSGVDGYRLDAVKHIDMQWLTDLRKQVKALTPGAQPFYMVGETFTNSKSLLKQYIDPATKLDGQFDFPLRAELVKVILMRQGTFYDLHGFLNANDGYYGSGAIMGTFIGNHDLPRSIHLAEDTPQFGQWDSGKSRAWFNLPSQPNYAKPYERLAVAYTALLTLPGIPLIYYGDEVGLAGGGDPDNRRPMPWSGHNSHQSALKAHMTKLTKIRAQHPALRHGARKQHWVANDVYAYSMTQGADKLYVVLNRSDSQQQISLPGTSYKDLINGATVSAAKVVLPPRSALVLQ
jgi:glycosidase